MKTKILAFASAFLMLAACSPLEAPREVSIVPVPQSVEQGQGEYKLQSGSSIVVVDTTLGAVAQYMAQTIERSVGLKLVATDAAKGDVTMAMDLGGENLEAYRLTVDGDGVRIQCNAAQGAIMAVATLEQLLPNDSQHGARLQYVTINDAPRFGYRGLMLDVSRHFQDIDGVKHVLDLMARYKLNKFHWHLTDDQGWRIEIKQYPDLTAKGAWRKWNWQDKQCMTYEKELDNPDFAIPEKFMKIEGVDTLYGGFYTQDEIRDVVRYAGERGIDVLPELDMPGHLMAAILGYPFISCKGQAQWGESFSDPLCIGNDEAIAFVKNIYTEVAGLFPYEYMHLGADEVEKTNWKACPKCQARIKSEKLKSVDELQAWFVHDMERHFNSLGKKLIGWDEILDGGLSPTATIMWWRDWAPNAVPTATASGNKAIMTPCFNLYLDAWETKTTLHNTYTWEPILKDLSAAQAANIIGVQGNLWCETIPSMARIEHQYFPRLLALSEMGWSTPDKKNWDEFFARVVRQVEWLDAHKIAYRVPDLTGFENINVFTDTMSVKIECPLPMIQVRYTTDGSMPSINSPLMPQTMLLDSTTKFIFRGFRPDATAGEMFRAEYRKESYAPAVDTVLTLKGLQVKQYEYKGKACAEIETAPLVKSYTLDSLNLRGEVKGWMSLICQGYIDIPADGVYTFGLNSNDGSMLYIDGKMLIDNDKPHGDRLQTAQKALGKGLHKVRVEFFDMNNGGCLSLTLNGRVISDFKH
ncbi:MAG: family 20 glycosylhydrolase [Mucinivorans sp.]